MCSQLVHLLGSNLRKDASCPVNPGQGVLSVSVSVCFFGTTLEARGEGEMGAGRCPCWVLLLVGCFFELAEFVLLGKVCNGHIVYHIRVSKCIMA